MVSARPQAHVTLPGRPAHAPAAEDVRVDVRHLLPGIRAVVEHDAIPGPANALGGRGPVREPGHFLEQAAGLGDRRQVDVMFPRHDQEMRGRLRIDIAEHETPCVFLHDFGRNLTGSDRAE